MVSPRYFFQIEVMMREQALRSCRLSDFARVLVCGHAFPRAAGLPGTCPIESVQQGTVRSLPGLISRPKGGTPIGPNHTVPKGWNLFVLTTRHFVPGYLHRVPTGQTQLTPVHIFEATSLRAAGFEKEDENETANAWRRGFT